MPKVRIILQVDDDPAITYGAKMVFDKSISLEGGSYLTAWYRWDKNTNTLFFLQGYNKVVRYELNSPGPIIDKLLITGHGGGEDNNRTVGGLNATELAKVVQKALYEFVNPSTGAEKISIKRITLDACRMKINFIEKFHGEFANKVNGISIDVEQVRAYEAFLTSDRAGHRYTTTFEKNAWVTRYKDKSVRIFSPMFFDDVLQMLNNSLSDAAKGDIKTMDRMPGFANDVKAQKIEDYLNKNIIDSFLINLFPGNESISLLQTKQDRNDYLILRPYGVSADNAYILRSLIPQGNTPAWIDIQIDGEKGGTRFLFTQALTGGSLIVTKHPEAGKKSDWYRVYHDTRQNASVFYNEVIMAVDYEDYALPAGETGKALSTSFLYYGDMRGKKQWVIVNQPLKLSTQNDSQPAERSGRPVNQKAQSDYKPLNLDQKFIESENTIGDLLKQYKVDDTISLDKLLMDNIDDLIREYEQEDGKSFSEIEELEKKTWEDYNKLKTSISYLETQKILKNKETAVVNLPQDRLSSLMIDNERHALSSRTHFEFDKIYSNKTWYFRGASATKDLLTANSTLLNKDHEYIPLLHAIDATPSKNVSVPVLDTTTLETVTLSTEDPRLHEFKTYLDEQTTAINEGDPVEGLNAALTIQALMGFFTHRSQSAGNFKDLPPLAQAMEIHSYFNLVQAVYGTGMDVKNMVKLTQSVFSDGIIATESTASRVSGALSHVAEGAGLLMGIGNMVLDSIELSKANTSSQKAIFGTQLAFDSAGTLLSVTGIGAGLLGAASAGAVISGVGVLLGGLAVGFAGLAQAFGKVADDAEAVGLYFDQVFKAYQKGYYLDNSASPQIARIDLGAVVAKVDLGARQVTFGSQMLYRTHHGSTGSGKINYFFWAGDMPEEVRDRNQALNVRAVWNNNKVRDTQLPDTGSMPVITADTPILLPGTPPSYIGYNYNLLAGATTKHATGFDLWRTMEEDKKFDFDFYIFPGERIIDTLYQEYDGSSPIEIVLDKADRQLVVPVLPEKIKGNIRYRIHNQGYQCVINLNAGVSLTLTAPENATGVRWVLTPGNISADFTFNGSALQLGNDIWITVDGANSGEILVIQQNKEICRVDMQQKTFTPVQEEGGNWKNVDALHDYLKELAKEHKLDGQYVLIKNFQPAGSQKTAGNAYYDVQEDRFLYTSGLPSDTADSANLVGVIEDEAFFFSPVSKTVWATDLKTFTRSKEYTLLLAGGNTQIEKAWISAGVVSILQSIDPPGARTAELIYQIDNDRPALLAVFGADHLIDKLTQKDAITAGTDLRVFLTDNISHLGHVIHMGTPDPEPAPFSACLGEVISIGTDTATVDPKLLWINTKKKNIVVPRMSGISGTDFTKGHFSLVHCAPNRKGQTVHYFLYNPNPDATASGAPADALLPLRLFVQTENEPATEVQITGLAYTMPQDDKFFAVTDEGYIFYIDTEGTLFLEALTEAWLKKNPVWWEALPGLKKQFLAAHTNIPVIGLAVRAGGNIFTFPVWYNVVKQSIVITPVSPFNTATSPSGYPDFAFLGVAEDKQGAYFLDAHNGKVYWQPLPIYRQIEAACAGGYDQLDLSAFPVSTAVLADRKISNAYVDQDQLCVILEEGLVLKVDLEQNTRIVAVQHQWVEKNRDTLTVSLNAVCEKYKYDGESISVFAAKDPSDDSLSWYLPGPQVLLSPPVQPGQVLTYIGYNAAGQTGFFADMNGGAFFSFKDKKLESLFQFDWVSRFSELFAVIGSETGTVLSVPVIDHCETVMLATHHGNCQYTVEKNAWEYYSEITIDSRGAKPDTVLLPFTNLSRLSAVKYGDDLLVVESGAEGRYLTIKNAFTPDHPGVIIKTFTPVSVHSSKIASIMATYNLASLDLSVQGLALKPVVIKPFTFPNQNLRMDATGVDASHLTGGVVNGNFYEVGATEQFYLIGQPDGTFVIASVASPGVYLRMDAKAVKEFTNSGGGVVNCQYGIGPMTKFYIVPQGTGVSFASQAFPGVFLRYDGTNLIGAPGGKIGGIINCQFGAKTLETFTINPVR